jgi:glucose/arabinose dehydrogenase
VRRPSVRWLLLVALLAACADDPGTPRQAPPAATGDPSPGPEGPAEPATPDEDQDDAAEAAEPVLTDVVTGLDAPWDLVWAGDDRLLVSERDRGRLLEIGEDGAVQERRTFEVDPAGEGGLLGLAVHPDDETLVYAYLTGATDNRVVRFELDGDDEPEPVLTGIPKASIHNGGRIAFGPDGLLYVGTGDAAEPARSSDPDDLAGKVLRVTPDGEVPADNPEPGSPVYALGLRNVQGLAWDLDGQLWVSELGPDVDDEVNRIVPGGHYGWPEVTGAPGDDRFEDAAFVAQPPEASWSGAAIAEDPAVPGWEGDLFVAALRGERLWRLSLADGEVVADEELLVGELGRLRTVRVGPDGALYLLTTNRDGRGAPRDGDDRLVRFGPP